MPVHCLCGCESGEGHRRCCAGVGNVLAGKKSIGDAAHCLLMCTQTVTALAPEIDRIVRDEFACQLEFMDFFTRESDVSPPGAATALNHPVTQIMRYISNLGIVFSSSIIHQNYNLIQSFSRKVAVATYADTDLLEQEFCIEIGSECRFLHYLLHRLSAHGNEFLLTYFMQGVRTRMRKTGVTEMQVERIMGFMWTIRDVHGATPWLLSHIYGRQDVVVKHMYADCKVMTKDFVHSSAHVDSFDFTPLDYLSLAKDVDTQQLRALFKHYVYASNKAGICSYFGLLHLARRAEGGGVSIADWVDNATLPGTCSEWVSGVRHGQAVLHTCGTYLAGVKGVCVDPSRVLTAELFKKFMYDHHLVTFKNKVLGTGMDNLFLLDARIVQQVFVSFPPHALLSYVECMEKLYNSKFELLLGGLPSELQGGKLVAKAVADVTAAPRVISGDDEVLLQARMQPYDHDSVLRPSQLQLGTCLCFFLQLRFYSAGMNVPASCYPVFRHLIRNYGISPFAFTGSGSPQAADKIVQKMDGLSMFLRAREFGDIELLVEIMRICPDEDIGALYWQSKYVACGGPVKIDISMYVLRDGMRATDGGAKDSDDGGGGAKGGGAKGGGAASNKNSHRRLCKKRNGRGGFLKHKNIYKWTPELRDELASERGKLRTIAFGFFPYEVVDDIAVYADTLVQLEARLTKKTEAVTCIDMITEEILLVNDSYLNFLHYSALEIGGSCGMACLLTDLSPKRFPYGNYWFQDMDPLHVGCYLGMDRRSLTYLNTKMDRDGYPVVGGAAEKKPCDVLFYNQRVLRWENAMDVAVQACCIMPLVYLTECGVRCAQRHTAVDSRFGAEVDRGVAPVLQCRYVFGSNKELLTQMRQLVFNAQMYKDLEQTSDLLRDIEEDEAREREKRNRKAEKQRTKKQRETQRHAIAKEQREEKARLAQEMERSRLEEAAALRSAEKAKKQMRKNAAKKKETQLLIEQAPDIFVQPAPKPTASPTESSPPASSKKKKRTSASQKQAGTQDAVTPSVQLQVDWESCNPDFFLEDDYADAAVSLVTDNTPKLEREFGKGLAVDVFLLDSAGSSTDCSTDEYFTGVSTGTASSTGAASTGAEPVSSMRVFQFSAAAESFVVCPISMEIMQDPVICTNGQTYNRNSIEGWFRKCRKGTAAGAVTVFTDPLTGDTLQSDILVPNILIRKLVQDLRAQEISLDYHMLATGGCKWASRYDAVFF